MAISTDSYGSTTGVAGLVPRYAGTGDFTVSTRPTLSQVESYIDSISGMLNSMLAEAGFTIPISQTRVKVALDYFVNEEVASIAEGINGSGRFGPTAKSPGKRGRFAIILDEIQTFIEANKAGFERLGAARAYSATAGLGYRSTDERGNPTFPLTQRAAFGETFQDWDSANA